MIRKILLLFFILFFSFSQLYSQGKLKQSIKNRKEAKTLAFEEDKPWFSPIIAPAYTADAGLLISGGFLYSFRMNANDSISQRSTLPATIFYSSKGNFGIRAFLKTYWLEDKLRLNAAIIVTDKDNNYHGKGYEQIESTNQSDSTTLYHEMVTTTGIELIYEIYPSLYMGMRVKPGYAKTRDFAAQVEDDPYRSQFADEYFLNGIGGQITYDTRDIAVNAWRGVYVNIMGTFYDNIWGSAYDFQEYWLDTRFYQTLNRPGNVLAFQFYCRSTYGEVPITELSDFSGGKKLRGYHLGHYRDNTTAFLLGEWRYTFRKSDNSLSKSGIVVWAGTGSIAPDVAHLTKWLPNAGFGYRFELQPRMNVCVDFGVGRNTQGIYFNFVEAF